MSHTFCCINLPAQEQRAQEHPAGCLCTGIAHLELYLLLEPKIQGLVVHLPADAPAPDQLVTHWSQIANPLCRATWLQSSARL
jgi:hypothetical protein